MAGQGGEKEMTMNIYKPADARALAADILAAADEVEGVERKSESDYARRRAAIILGQVRP